MWLILWWKKDPLRTTVLTFYFNDESGKLPRWNIYYTKCILLRRKLTREASGNYMYLQYVDLSSPHFCETSVSDLANIFGLWPVFEIRHLNFRYVHLYLCSQWAILTRHFEIKMPVALFNGNWQKVKVLFICFGGFFSFLFFWLCI